ncbi:Uncharacterised protein [Mycobacteroides abscessus subsp. abscessus]|nr:Uncharacterised protein [Mycobacteroides abscessus subsp. abscessus]
MGVVDRELAVGHTRQHEVGDHIVGLLDGGLRLGELAQSGLGYLCDQLAHATEICVDRHGGGARRGSDLACLQCVGALFVEKPHGRGDKIDPRIADHRPVGSLTISSGR